MPNLLQDGLRRLRWLSDRELNAVVFIGVDEGGVRRWGGTGFILHHEDAGRRFHYLITAEHVVRAARDASDDGQVWIRYTSNEGNAKEIKAPGEFHFGSELADGADVAAQILHLHDDVTPCVSANRIVTDEVVRSYEVGPGDTTFAVGLYVRMPGSQSISPIVRSGIVAALPLDRYQKLPYSFVPYLVESHSIGGLSGSPVYLVLREPFIDGKHFGGVLTETFLLGLAHGHWDLNVRTGGLDSDESAGHSDGSFHYELGDSIQKINEGIAVVVPGSQILDLLNADDVQAERDELSRQWDLTKGEEE